MTSDTDKTFNLRYTVISNRLWIVSLLVISRIPSEQH